MKTMWPPKYKDGKAKNRVWRVMRNSQDAFHRRAMRDMGALDDNEMPSEEGWNGYGRHVVSVWVNPEFRGKV